MAYSVADLLGYIPLMEPVETTKTGIPNVLPPEFWTTTEDVPGHLARVVEMPGTRRVASVSPYGSPPRLVDKVSLSVRDIMLLHTIEEMAFRDELFRMLMDWGKYTPQDKMAKEEIVRQGEQWRQKHDNLDVAAVTLLLGAGAGTLWFDGNGKPLPSSSGAKLTVDQLVPANNKNQLNGLISASWATAATDIVSQINAIKVQAIQDTGYRLKYAFYGKNIPGYFAKNDSIKLFWQYNQALNTSYMSTGIMPKEFLELIWLPGQLAFYEKDDGTKVSLFPDDQVTFTPEINAQTYAYLRGSYPVPKGFAWGGSAQDVLNSVDLVYGRFRYAYGKFNPTAIVDTMGSTWLPRLKVPNAYYFADVTP